MKFLPVFSLLGSFLGGGGKEEKSAPEPVREEREVAPTVEEGPATAGAKQRAAVRQDRDKRISGESLSTRSGVNIVGGGGN